MLYHNHAISNGFATIFREWMLFTPFPSFRSYVCVYFFLYFPFVQVWWGPLRAHTAQQWHKLNLFIFVSLKFIYFFTLCNFSVFIVAKRLNVRWFVIWLSHFVRNSTKRDHLFAILPQFYLFSSFFLLVLVWCISVAFCVFVFHICLIYRRHFHNVRKWYKRRKLLNKNTTTIQGEK